MEDKISQRTGEKNDVARRQLDLAGELFGSGVIVQFFGVTAGLVGCFVFFFSKLDYFNPSNKGLVPIFAFVWPIIVAYAILSISLFFWLPFKSFRFWSTTRAALLYIYFVFIFSDIVLLGFLVWRTGGPHNSIFTPIFLLIPSVGSCYCNPKRLFFRIMIVAVILMFFVVSAVEFIGLTPSFAVEDSGTVLDEVSVQEVICACVFTIACISAAAFCYYWTDRIRKKYCRYERSDANERPNVCDVFFL